MLRLRPPRWTTSHDEFIFATFSGSIGCFSTAPRTENDFSEAMGVGAAPVKSSAAAPPAPQPQPGVKLPGVAAPAGDGPASTALLPPPPVPPKKDVAPTAASSSFFASISEKLGLGSGSSRSEAPATAADALKQQREERAQGISSMIVRLLLLLMCMYIFSENITRVQAEVARLQKAVQAKKQELAKVARPPPPPPIHLP